MTIYVNGREIEAHGLLGKSEARKRAGLYPAGFLQVLDRSARDELKDSRCIVVEEIQELNRALYESGADLEPPPDLAREGEKKGRLESFLRRVQTRFIRAVCEGYVQQQQLFNSYFNKALILSFLQVYGKGEGLDPEEGADLGARVFRAGGWDAETVEEIGEACRGASCVVLGIPSLDLLETLRDRGRLVLALDPSEEMVSRAQNRILPAWCGTRFVDLLRFVEGGVEVVVVLYPEIFTGEELDAIIGWAADNLADGGRILVARNIPIRGVVVSREGTARPRPSTFLHALLRKHGFEVEKLSFGKKSFLAGRRCGLGVTQPIEGAVSPGTG